MRTWTFDNSGALREVHVHKSHVGAVDNIAWNPADSNLLASAAADKNLILWDTRTGKPASSIGIKGSPLHVQWAHDGSMLGVSTRDDTLFFIDARKACVIGSHAFPQELNEFTFTPSGLLVTGTGIRNGVLDEGNVAVFQVQRTHVLQAAQHAASGPAQRAVGGAAVAVVAEAGVGVPSTAPAGGAVRVTEVTRARGHAAPVSFLRPSPNWAKLATGAADGLVCIWDACELTCVGSIDRSDGQIRGIAWSGSGSHLAIGSGDTNDLTKTLDIIRVDGTLIKRLSGPVSMNCVSWCPTAPLIAFGMDDVAGSAAAAAVVSAGSGGRGGAGHTGAGPNTQDFAVKILAA